jgi:hypothetical protein
MSVDVLDILTIWPPFSAETTSPVIPATLLSAIRALLADIGGLGGIDRIVTGSAGSIGFPHIVIGRLRAEPTYNSKRFYEQDYSFEITVASLDPDEAEDIGKEARRRLMPAGGDFPKLVFSDGYEIRRSPRQVREFDRPGEGPDGETVFFFQFDELISVDRVM